MSQSTETKSNTPENILVIPRGTTKIGEAEFNGRNELTSVIIPDTVTEIITVR